MKHETPSIGRIVLLHLYSSFVSASIAVILGGTSAALTNGVSHVTKACGMGIEGCGASQHWAIWSVSLAVLFYAGMISCLIWGSTYQPMFTSRRGSNLSSVINSGAWVRGRLAASRESSRYKQWLVLSLLVGVIGVAASAAIGGAVGGFLYGNFITGMGAANGVPLIGWLFGIAFGMSAGGVSAMLFGILLGGISGVLLPRQR